jgi:hypothetical protein
VNALARRHHGRHVGLHQAAHVVDERAGGVDDDAGAQADRRTALVVARDDSVGKAGLVLGDANDRRIAAPCSTAVCTMLIRKRASSNWPS